MSALIQDKSWNTYFYFKLSFKKDHWKIQCIRKKGYYFQWKWTVITYFFSNALFIVSVPKMAQKRDKMHLINGEVTFSTWKIADTSNLVVATKVSANCIRLIVLHHITYI